MKSHQKSEAGAGGTWSDSEDILGLEVLEIVEKKIMRAIKTEEREAWMHKEERRRREKSVETRCK